MDRRPPLIVALLLSCLTACSTAQPAGRMPSPGASLPDGPAETVTASVTSSSACQVLRGPAEVPGDARLEPAGAGRHAVLVPRGFVAVVDVTPSAAPLQIRAGRLCSPTPAVVTGRRTSLVVSATWHGRGASRRLAVTPGSAARGWTGAAPYVLTALAKDHPEVLAPGMADQLRCHVMFAPSKGTWNLEPERPAVGWPALVASRCNPGMPRDVDGL